MSTGLVPAEFLGLVIRPVLAALSEADPRLSTPAAERLMLGTAVYESRLRHMAQIGGPARSLFQIEPPTFNDVWQWITMSGGEKLRQASARFCFSGIRASDQYAGNQHLACVVARVLYWRRPEAMPAAADVDGLAAYYKRWFNTPLGAGKASAWASTFTAECADAFF